MIVIMGLSEGTIRGRGDRKRERENNVEKFCICV
jgi:hypothetical protein